MKQFSYKLFGAHALMFLGLIGGASAVFAGPMNDGFYHMEDFRNNKQELAPARNEAVAPIVQQDAKTDHRSSDAHPAPFQAPDVLVDGKKCFWKSLDFAKAFYKKNAQNQAIVQIEGVKPYTNMKVMLFPIIDEEGGKQATYVHVVGCLPGDTGEAEQKPYRVTMPVENLAFKRSLTIVGRTKSKTL